MLLAFAMTATVLQRADLPSAEPRDDLLVRRLQRGDAAALCEAYDQHHEVVRAFARRLLRDEAAAEDLVHDVFVELPSVMRRYEGRSSLRTFILSIAVNHARHAKRATARRLGAYERLHAEPRDEDGGQHPERDHERKVLADMLERALAKLPLDQRIAVVLCIVEERTSGEAAEIARVPEATIRTRLHYARKRLKELLEVELARGERTLRRVR